jgi:hypothetical protein
LKQLPNMKVRNNGSSLEVRIGIQAIDTHL